MHKLRDRLNHIKNFLKLIRWFHELLAILPFLALYLIIDHFLKISAVSCELSSFNFFLLCVCVLLLIAAGCIHNDIMDRHIDKINKPKTHTVDRTISLQSAKRAFLILSLMIFLLSIYISCYIFSEWVFISAAVYVLSWLYNVYLKRSPLFGNITIAALASFIPLVILLFAEECIQRLANEKIHILVYLYSFFPFLVIIARELSLDISDMEGDKAGGCRTLPIVIGVKRSKHVVILILLFIILLSLVVMHAYTYLLPVFLLVDLLLLLYIQLLRKTETRLDYIKIGRFLWFIMILGLIGFALVTLA